MQIILGFGRSSKVTILILVDGFLQYVDSFITDNKIISHNPYFSRWFSAIKLRITFVIMLKLVTILILVDGFLQYYG